LSYPDLSGKSGKLSSSSFDDLPEAIRETQAAQPRRGRPLIAWLGLSTVLIGGGAGTYQLLQLRPNPPAQSAQPNPPATSPTGSASTDGTILGHYPYPEVAAAELEPITADGAIKLQRAAARAFQEMRAAAQSDGVVLVALSGFRDKRDQEHLFFDVKKERVQTTEQRADVSAPPGYSEHHTGYAIDIGDGNTPATDLSPNFETTTAFRWLQANAPRFSFELSFPKGNQQGVNYEPWHWRYVGDTASLEMFYKARGNTTPTPAPSVGTPSSETTAAPESTTIP
jgi:D-alanyl-D-alanine carboxypeptidase